MNKIIYFGMSPASNRWIGAPCEQGYLSGTGIPDTCEVAVKVSPHGFQLLVNLTAGSIHHHPGKHAALSLKRHSLIPSSELQQLHVCSSAPIGASASYQFVSLLLHVWMCMWSTKIHRLSATSNLQEERNNSICPAHVLFNLTRKTREKQVAEYYVTFLASVLVAVLIPRKNYASDTNSSNRTPAARQQPSQPSYSKSFFNYWLGSSRPPAPAPAFCCCSILLCESQRSRAFYFCNETASVLVKGSPWPSRHLRRKLPRPLLAVVDCDIRHYRLGPAVSATE